VRLPGGDGWHVDTAPIPKIKEVHRRRPIGLSADRTGREFGVLPHLLQRLPPRIDTDAHAPDHLGVGNPKRGVLWCGIGHCRAPPENLHASTFPPRWGIAFLTKSAEHVRGLEPGEALSAVHAEMEQLAKAINASPVNSIEGLRVKALVAFWEVAPLGADQAEFSFEDAYPFQQLFTAVAEFCGLKDKMAATGYELPDIAMVDDDSDDDSDDEGEEA
jgi:hypothetical protein